MAFEIHARFDTGLPPDDDHPYRSGAWRPQTAEYDAWDMDVIGRIPDDLAGTYLRNTENPLWEPIRRYHPFDGDGMLHAITFEDGEARYANRFVRTDGLVAEQSERRSLWPGITEHPSDARVDHGWGARTMLKDAASTDVVVHDHVALASFYQCGELYRLDPRTLEDLGRTRWDGWFPPEGVSAHPKVDEHTGELLFFNYSTDAPYMHYGVVSADGELTDYINVPLPGPRLPHDMAFTEHWSILNDLPYHWDPVALSEGWYRNVFRRDQPSRFALVPRHGSTDDIRWFEADPTFVLHFTNAYEDGDTVVLDGYFQANPHGDGVARASDERRKGFETLDFGNLGVRAHRWIFDLTTGQTAEHDLSDRPMEFPMINGRHGGRRHRYSYNGLCTPGLFAFDGLVKFDADTGAEEVRWFDDGVFVSETVMAPRIGSNAEDDGYLITFASDVNADASECLVLDAARPLDEPVARIRLPERISSGTHSTWAPSPGLELGPASL